MTWHCHSSPRGLSVKSRRVNSLMITVLKMSVKSLSRVQLFTTPWIAAYQAPPTMGFSRQEYRSGVPLPSPMHESEKWSHSVVSNSSRPHGLQPTRLLRSWDFPGKSTGVGCHCLLPWKCIACCKFGFSTLSSDSFILEAIRISQHG